jgi:predicted nucleic acid-binding protein
MNVLIDTNVALDYFLKREGFAENAKRIFYEIISGDINGCLSSSVVTDLYFSINKRKDKHVARNVVEEVYRYLTILTVGEDTIGDALSLPMDDFEDAVQAAAAQDFGVDIIVTRDTTGFLNSGLTVYSPEEFLEMLETNS